MRQIERPTLNFKLPAKITKRKKWYLASCPVLDVHSQGETEEKARTNLAEAVSLFLASCLERNTLDAVLKECGLRFATPSGPDKIRRVVSQVDYIDVPIPFFLTRTHHSACHA